MIGVVGLGLEAQNFSGVAGHNDLDEVGIVHHAVFYGGQVDVGIAVVIGHPDPFQGLKAQAAHKGFGLFHAFLGGEPALVQLAHVVHQQDLAAPFGHLHKKAPALGVGDLEVKGGQKSVGLLLVFHGQLAQKGQLIAEVLLGCGPVHFLGGQPLGLDVLQRVRKGPVVDHGGIFGLGVLDGREVLVQIGVGAQGVLVMGGEQIALVDLFGHGAHLVGERQADVVQFLDGLQVLGRQGAALGHLGDQAVAEISGLVDELGQLQQGALGGREGGKADRSGVGLAGDVVQVADDLDAAGGHHQLGQLDLEVVQVVVQLVKGAVVKVLQLLAVALPLAEQGVHGQSGEGDQGGQHRGDHRDGEGPAPPAPVRGERSCGLFFHKNLLTGRRCGCRWWSPASGTRSRRRWRSWG